MINYSYWGRKPDFVLQQTETENLQFLLQPKYFCCCEWSDFFRLSEIAILKNNNLILDLLNNFIMCFRGFNKNTLYQEYIVRFFNKNILYLVPLIGYIWQREGERRRREGTGGLLHPPPKKQKRFGRKMPDQWVLVLDRKCKKYTIDLPTTKIVLKNKFILYINNFIH